MLRHRDSPGYRLPPWSSNSEQLVKLLFGLWNMALRGWELSEEEPVQISLLGARAVSPHNCMHGLPLMIQNQIHTPHVV